MKYSLLLNFALFLCICMPLKAVVKGSNTAVSVEPYYTFPAVDSDNEMRGFGWFKNGFGLENSSTTVTYDSVYPISGTMDMQGGTLLLESDLSLHYPLMITSFGVIDGNDHHLEFCMGVDQAPSDVTFKDLYIDFRDNVNLNKTVTIQGDCTFDGHGSIIRLVEYGEFVVDTNATMKFRNIIIEGANGNNIRCYDDTGAITLSNTTFCFSDDFTFDSGALRIQDNVNFMGPDAYYFIYSSSETCFVASKTCWHFSRGLGLQIGKQASDGSESISFEDDTSVVQFEESDLLVTDYGVTLTRGRIEFLRNATISSPLAGWETGIILGDGIYEDNDITIYLGPGCDVLFTSGWLTYNNVLNNRFYAAAPSCRFIRLSDSYFYMLQDCLFPENTLEFTVTTQFPPTVLATGKKLYYDNTRIVTPYGAAYMNGYRYDCFCSILDGNDTILLEMGEFPLAVKVINQNNVIRGSSDITGTIVFEDSSASLYLAFSGLMRTDIALAGGTLALGSNLMFGRSYSFSSGGTISLGSNRLAFGTEDFICNAAITWVSDDAAIDVRSTLTLTNEWTFTGDTTIEGHGNRLDLATGGKIIIASGATVRLHDLTIDNLDESDIVCVDETGTLILDDVFWLQHTDVTFSTGTLEIYDLVKMRGEGKTFTYSSDQPIIIGADSQLTLNSQFTFFYNPSIDSGDLITLTDETSGLAFDGCTFHVSTSGLNLTNGYINILSDSVICSDKEVLEDDSVVNVGISFGDGTSENDLTIDISSGSMLYVSCGALNYHNVNSNSFRPRCGSTLSIATDTTLRLYENMTFDHGTISFSANAILARVVGKQIYGALHAAGRYIMTTVSGTVSSGDGSK